MPCTSIQQARRNGLAFQGSHSTWRWPLDPHGIERARPGTGSQAKRKADKIRPAKDACNTANGKARTRVFACTTAHLMQGPLLRRLGVESPYFIWFSDSTDALADEVLRRAMLAFSVLADAFRFGIKTNR